VIGLGLSTFLFFRERVARQEAKTEVSKSLQIAHLLENTLAGVDPAVARGMDTKLLTMILTNTAAMVGRELTNQPDVEADMRMVLGKTFASIGQGSNALAQTSLRFRLRLHRHHVRSYESAGNWTVPADNPRYPDCRVAVDHRLHLFDPGSG